MGRVTDEAILRLTKRIAFVAWLLALGVGLCAGVARHSGREGLADVLLAMVWCAGGVFFMCWSILAISTIIRIASRSRGMD